MREDVLVERSKKSRHQTQRSRNAVSDFADFLDVAGHELRSPLTSLKGHAQILQRRVAKQQDRDADTAELNKILYQISRLEHELDVYLEAARLLSRRFRVQVERVDLVALARRMVELQNSGAADDVLRLETSAEELIGLWDRRRIQLALGALLSNASKYGLGRDVVVRLSATETGVRVAVEDEGLGVLPGERRGIFGAYVTGGNVENAGLGLGLYVAREIVKRHGGRIGMRARVGGGSVFWFEVPNTSAANNVAQTIHSTEVSATHLPASVQH